MRRLSVKTLQQFFSSETFSKIYYLLENSSWKMLSCPIKGIVITSIEMTESYQWVGNPVVNWGRDACVMYLCKLKYVFADSSPVINVDRYELID